MLVKVTFKSESASSATVTTMTRAASWSCHSQISTVMSKNSSTLSKRPTIQIKLILLRMFKVLSRWCWCKIGHLNQSRELCSSVTFLAMIPGMIVLTQVKKIIQKECLLDILLETWCRKWCTKILVSNSWNWLITLKKWRIKWKIITNKWTLLTSWLLNGQLKCNTKCKWRSSNNW